MKKTRRSERSARSEYRARDEHLDEKVHIEEHRNTVTVTAKNYGQKELIKSIIKNKITICEGPAGVGKTAVSIGMGLQDLLSNKVEKIIIMRPIIEACGEELGFLPGDVADKMSVWLMPIQDNLAVFVDQSKIDYLLRQKKIEALPLAYARGRSLNHSFVILEEAQNCSPKQLLMALTRLGEDSKMVISGDITQNDKNERGMTGLQDCIERLEEMQDVGIVRMKEVDIVRNPMIREIIARYRNV